MKNIELLGVGLRLVGVYGLIKAIQYAGIGYQYIKQFIEHMPNESLIFWYIAYGLTVSGLLICSLTLIKFPITVAHKLLSITNEKEITFHGSSRDIQNTGFTLLGVYILSTAIPDLVYNGSVMIFMSEQGNYLPSDKMTYVINSLVTLIEIMIGLYLCFGANKLSGIFDRTRKVD